MVADRHRARQVYLRLRTEALARGGARLRPHRRVLAGKDSTFESLLQVDAVLVQTSIGLGDLAEHPPLRVAGNVSIFWQPIHHSNLQDLRANAAARVGRVGVHTVHRDAMLYDTLSRHASRWGIEFVHMDPGLLFKYAGGRVTTPQQTDAVYLQLRTLDVGFVKQSGCVTEWWFCSRWKTGQRLVNMLSVGVPAVVWGDAQGHLDVVDGLWRPEDEDEEGWPAQRRPPRRDRGDGPVYPQQLVVSGDDGARAALEALVASEKLRHRASSAGLRLAARYALPRLAARLVRILARLERERLPRAAAHGARRRRWRGVLRGWRRAVARSSGCTPPWAAVARRQVPEKE